MECVTDDKRKFLPASANNSEALVTPDCRQEILHSAEAQMGNDIDVKCKTLRKQAGIPQFVFDPVLSG